MSDELITAGITLFSTFFGFALVKIYDWHTARKERQRTRAILNYKLYKLREILKAIRDEIQKFDKITKLQELELIREVLLRSEFQKEFPKMELLFEKLFVPNIKNPDIFVHFSNLNIYVDHLLGIGNVRNADFPDQKPAIMVAFIVTIDAFNKIIEDVSKN
jgi:hypothetical protein